VLTDREENYLRKLAKSEPRHAIMSRMILTVLGEHPGGMTEKDLSRECLKRLNAGSN
jgi:hypothetical protein